MALTSQTKLTQEQYNAMFIAQYGLCAICGKPETVIGRHRQPKALSVDHDHKTGKIRSLLCCKCNLGIGNFDDDIALFRRVISYLESHSS